MQQKPSQGLEPGAMLVFAPLGPQGKAQSTEEETARSKITYSTGLGESTHAGATNKGPVDVNVNVINTFPATEASPAETAPVQDDDHCKSQLAQERLELDQQRRQLQMERGELQRVQANQGAAADTTAWTPLAHERHALQDEIAKVKRESKTLRKEGSSGSNVAEQSQALQKETKKLKRGLCYSNMAL